MTVPSHMLDELDEALISAFRQYASSWRLGADRTGAGFEKSHYMALLCISDQKSVKLGDLAAQVNLDQSTVSRYVAQLAELGFVEKINDPEDKRVFRVQVSKKGDEFIAQAKKIRQDILGKALCNWSKEEVDQLREFLTRLSKNISEIGS
jgi:DNA-binding MarR family transcriptional regulator